MSGSRPSMRMKGQSEPHSSRAGLACTSASWNSRKSGVVGRALRAAAHRKLHPDAAFAQQAEEILEPGIGNPLGDFQHGHVFDDDRHSACEQAWHLLDESRQFRPDVRVPAACREARCECGYLVGFDGPRPRSASAGTARRRSEALEHPHHASHRGGNRRQWGAPQRRHVAALAPVQARGASTLYPYPAESAGQVRSDRVDGIQHAPMMVGRCERHRMVRRIDQGIAIKARIHVYACRTRRMEVRCAVGAG